MAILEIDFRKTRKAIVKVFFAYLLFRTGFFGTLVAAIFFLVIKSRKGFFADFAFLFHSNPPPYKQ
jgi:hypothetical protein